LLKFADPVRGEMPILSAIATHPCALNLESGF